MLRNITQICVLFTVASIASSLFAEDWPTWRHNRTRSAVSSEKLKLPLINAWYFRSRLARIAPRDLPIRPAATRQFGATVHEVLPEHARYSLSIIAAGDAVFFTSHDGRIVCLDAAKGQTRWEFLAGAAITCAPFYADGKVYAGSDDGYVYCLDAKAGKQLWKYKPVTNDRWFLSFGRISSIWPVRTDVLVDDGIAYYGAGIFPHDGMFVGAVDANNAKRLWRSACYRYGFAGHLFASKRALVLPTELKGFHEKQVIFNRTGGTLHEFHDLQDPEIEQNLELLAEDGGGVVQNGIRYSTNRHDTLLAWNAEDKQDPRRRKTIWSVRVPGMLFDARDTALAGGVVYYLGNEHSASGTGGAVYAIDPKDGKQLWSVKIPERAHHIAVANGRLFVSTRQGSIYCFAAHDTPSHGVIDEPVETDFFEKQAALAEFRHVAQRAIEASGVRKGYALVLDCDSGTLAYELAKQSELYICAVFDDSEKARQARDAFARANLHCNRISVLHRKPGAPLSYSPNFVDLLLSEQAALGGTPPQYTAELENLLKPIRGIALIGGKQDEAKLRDWVNKTKLAASTSTLKWSLLTKKNEPTWVKHVRPVLENSGGWTHYNGNAGNTMCSHDDVLKPPLGIVWYGPPYAQAMFGRPPLLHNGVIVCPTSDRTIEAYDQYNGRYLWRYELSKTKKETKRDLWAMGVGGDSLYIPDGNVLAGIKNQGIVRINLWTGDVTRRYPAPESDARSAQFAVSADGKAFWWSGYGDKTDTESDWTCMHAIDTETGRTLWSTGGRGKKLASGLYEDGVSQERWNALADGRIYTLTEDQTDAQRDQLVAEMKTYFKTHAPERLDSYEKGPYKFRLLTARNAATGKVLYQRAVDLEGCDQVVAGRNGKVMFSMEVGGKYWKGWPRKNSLAVHDGATGKLLWKKQVSYRFAPIVTDNTIYAEPWAFDLATGKQKQRNHPVTGVPGDWSWARPDKQCGGSSGSTHFLFGRNKGFGYHDTLRDNGMYTSWHHRQSCLPDTATGGGMMIKPPFNTGCSCPWSMPYTMAMAKVSTETAIPFECYQTGSSTPVNHLRVNFGANGDRRDKDGNMWIHTRRRANQQNLQMTFASPMVFYTKGDGAQWATERAGRRSASDHPAENTDLPFVFDAFALGLKRYSVPVTTRADGKGTFTVRLGFSALTDDKPGQRVFDVKLNDKVVLKEFDIIKEAGKANLAIWREFTLAIDGDLVLDLVAKPDTPTAAQLPLICGMEIIRKDMATLGTELPENEWLGQSKRESEMILKLANFRAEPFSGRLVLKLPNGIQASLPNNGEIKLPSETRRDISIHLKADNTVEVGSHNVTVSLVSADGKIQLERQTRLDWLGPLERSVLATSGVYHAHPNGQKEWISHVRPPHYGGQLPVSRGRISLGDRGAVRSYLPFGIPREIGTIHRARVQLSVASNLGAIHRALYGRASAASDSIPADYWGALKPLKGPPWRDLRHLKFSDRPELLPDRYALSPTVHNPNVVEATVESEIVRDANGNGAIHFFIEPTALNGPVYWSNNGWNQDPANAPRLVIDYKPKKK